MCICVTNVDVDTQTQAHVIAVAQQAKENNMTEQEEVLDKFMKDLAEIDSLLRLIAKEICQLEIRQRLTEDRRKKLVDMYVKYQLDKAAES